MKRTLALWFFLICMSKSSGLMADPIAPPYIHNLVQKGEEVYVDIVTDTDPAVLSLEREGDDSSRLLVDKHDFTPDEALECISFDIAYCDLHADECHDCDDDGVPECREPCGSMDYGLRYIVLDDCVPPGKAYYRLYIYEDGDCEDWRGESITVIDAGQDCPDTHSDFDCEGSGHEADASVDAALPEDEDDKDAGGENTSTGEEINKQESGGGGCSVLPGRTGIHIILGLFMLITGLVFLFIRSGDDGI